MFIEGWTDKNGDSICHEPLGMFIHPDGERWSNRPFTKEQKKLQKQYLRLQKTIDKVIAHLNRTDRGIVDEINLINLGKSTLPKYCREFLLNN